MIDEKKKEGFYKIATARNQRNFEKLLKEKMSFSGFSIANVNTKIIH